MWCTITITFMKKNLYIKLISILHIIILHFWIDYRLAFFWLQLTVKMTASLNDSKLAALWDSVSLTLKLFASQLRTSTWFAAPLGAATLSLVWASAHVTDDDTVSKSAQCGHAELLRTNVCEQCLFVWPSVSYPSLSAGWTFITLSLLPKRGSLPQGA